MLVQRSYKPWAGWRGPVISIPRNKARCRAKRASHSGGAIRLALPSSLFTTVLRLCIESLCLKKNPLESRQIRNSGIKARTNAAQEISDVSILSCCSRCRDCKTQLRESAHLMMFQSIACLWCLLLESCSWIKDAWRRHDGRKSKVSLPSKITCLKCNWKVLFGSALLLFDSSHLWKKKGHTYEKLKSWPWKLFLQA